MRSRFERAGRGPGEQPSEAPTWPWALRDVLQAVAMHAAGPDKGRCANCHNLTGGLDMRVVSNGLVACGRCATHLETGHAQPGS